jgi:predicted metalloprotease
MEFDDQHVDVSGVDDQRGGGGGGGIGGSRIGGRTAAAGGGGIVAVIVTVVVLLLGGGGSGSTGGIDLSQLLPSGVSGGSSGETSAQLATRCNTAGAIDTYEDCYLIKVYDETDKVWSAEFTRLGLAYHRPRLTFFSGSVSTGCGEASSQVGPFYCPPDEKIYLDIDFLNQLQTQFGATGRYAQAYILAHEFGHHLQTLLGIEAKVRKGQQANPSQVNPLSVKMELQADCFAGVWGSLANKAGNVTVSQADVAQAQNAAAAVGDDRIEAQAGVRVNPESWTHGSAAQRKTWYTTGFTSGDINRCDTFSA